MLKEMEYLRLTLDLFNQFILNICSLISRNQGFEMGLDTVVLGLKEHTV